MKFRLGRLTAALLIPAALVAPAVRADEEPAKAKAHQLEFNGDGHVLIPALQYDGSHPLTLEAAIVPYELEESAGRTSIVGNLELSGVGLQYTGGHAMFHFNDGRDGNYGYASIDSNADLATEQAVHVAAVFDGKNVRLYVDGERQVSEETTTGPHKASIHPFMVGADPNKEGEPHQFFKGRIDELRISRVARYDDDFTPEAVFANDPDTLVLYHFDEGEGDIAKDSSNFHRHGHIVGATWVPPGESVDPTEDAR